MAHMDSKYYIDNIANFKLYDKETGHIYDMPCESISVTEDFDNSITDIDFNKAATLNFEAVLSGDTKVEDFVTTASMNVVDSIKQEVNEIKETLNSEDLINACKMIGEASRKAGISAKKAGEALANIFQRLKEYEEKEEDIFLETLKQIEKESEEIINGIYG